MKAAILYGPEKLKVENINDPEVKDDHVLIKIKASGFCGTDYMLYKGRITTDYPVILGHEFSGEIIEIGKNVGKLKMGDRVTIDPNTPCGKCFYCKLGEINLCKNMTSIGVTINGGFAEYALVPAKNVYSVSNNISFEEAALVEPLACCIHGIEQARNCLGGIIAILGTGGIGNIMIQLAKIYGTCLVIASEVDDEKAKVAKRSGADFIINPLEDDIIKKISEIEPEGVDLVIECSGSENAQKDSLKITRKGGTIIWFATSPISRNIPINPFEVYHKELTLIGSINNPFTHYKAVKLVESGKIILKHLISNRIALSEINSLFGIYENGKEVKILVVPDNSY